MDFIFKPLVYFYIFSSRRTLAQYDAVTVIWSPGLFVLRDNTIIIFSPGTGDCSFFYIQFLKNWMNNLHSASATFLIQIHNLSLETYIEQYLIKIKI